MSSTTAMVVSMLRKLEPPTTSRIFPLLIVLLQCSQKEAVIRNFLTLEGFMTTVVCEVYCTVTLAFRMRDIICRILMPFTAPTVAGLKLLTVKPSQSPAAGAPGKLFCKLCSMNRLVVGSNT